MDKLESAAVPLKNIQKALHSLLARGFLGPTVVFNAAAVKDLFDDYSQVAARLKQLAPDVFEDIRERPMPPVGGKKGADGRASIARHHLEQLLRDVESAIEIASSHHPPAQNEKVTTNTRAGVMATPIRLFISHSSEDHDVAVGLIRLIRSALNLPAEAIRCTSVDGYRLPGGADTNAQLKQEVHDADAFVGIVSEASVQSSYVLFELGARWGAGRHLLPLLAPGTPASVLAAPLNGLNALSCDSRAQLQQLVVDVGAILSISPGRADAFQADIDRLVSMRSRTGPAQ